MLARVTARATVCVPISVHHGCVHTLHAILLVRLMVRAGRIIFCNNANERSLCGFLHTEVDTRAAGDPRIFERPAKRRAEKGYGQNGGR